MVKLLSASLACQNYLVAKVKRAKSTTQGTTDGDFYDFRDRVLNTPVSMFDQQLLNTAAASIRRRYNLKEKDLLFAGYDVRLREWIDDILGYYQIDTLYVWLEKETGQSYSTLRNMKIGDTLLTHPRLISLVEKLERVTAKKLFVDVSTLLALMGEDCQFHEVLKYFAYGATAEDGKVAEVQKKWDELVSLYRKIIGVSASVSDADFLAMNVLSLVETKRNLLVTSHALMDAMHIWIKKFHMYFSAKTKVEDVLHMVYAVKFLGYRPAVRNTISRKVLLAMYRECAEMPASIKDEELLAMHVKDVVPSVGGAGNWDLILHWMEEKLNIQRPDIYDFVDDETTVLEFIDWLYEKI